MKVHWLIKYYFVAFVGIFSLVFYIENSEPKVNWSLYPEISESKVKSIILNKNCEELEELYQNEYYAKYKKNFLGFTVRNDKQSKKGLNFLKYIKYHLEKSGCI